MQHGNWDTYQKQWDFLPPDRMGVEATIIGCGSVGSMAAITLLKMGLSHIEVWDDDMIEQHNLPNQFLPDQPGEWKVTGLDQLAEVFGVSDRITTTARKWKEGKFSTPIAISAVDDMNARRSIFSACVRDSNVGLFVDVRTGGEYMKVYALDPHNADLRQEYLSTLHSNEQADPTPCTASQIIYTSLYAGAMIGHRVKQWIMCEEMPFQIIFDIQHEHIVHSKDCWRHLG
jgi:molybdopterin/thiamine biosynthesis adenylyltransferase